MTKLQIIQKEKLVDDSKNPATLYLVELLPGIRDVILKNGSFRPEYVGKSRIQSFMGGYLEDSALVYEMLKDAVTEGNVYEMINAMKEKKFDFITFPN